MSEVNTDDLEFRDFCNLFYNGGLLRLMIWRRENPDLYKKYFERMQREKRAANADRK